MNNTLYYIPVDNQEAALAQTIKESISYHQAIVDKNYDELASIITMANKRAFGSIYNKDSLEVYPQELVEDFYITKARVELAKEALSYLQDPVSNYWSLFNPVETLEGYLYRPLYRKHPNKELLLIKESINNPLWLYSSAEYLSSIEEVEHYIESVIEEDFYLVSNLEQEHLDPYLILVGWFNKHPDGIIYL